MSLWRRWTLFGALWGIVSLAAFLAAESSGSLMGIPKLVILVLALPTAIILGTLLTLLAPIFVPLASFMGAAFLLVPVALRAAIGGFTGYLVSIYREEHAVSRANGTTPEEAPWKEFRSHIADLIPHPHIRSLAFYPGHKLTSNGSGRLLHSYSVAWLSYRMARWLGLDPRTAARAGLLHDIGYNREDGMLKNILLHARRGADRARSIGEGREVWEAISRHMFPITPPPMSGHGLLLWTADKIAAVLELLGLEKIIW